MSIQTEIYKALEQLSEKNMFTEYVLAKKIRDNVKIDGKQKAGISYKDLEDSITAIGEEKQIYYALHLNSANDLLIKKDVETKVLTPEARMRRQSSEKSMSILSNGDVKEKNAGKSKNTKKNRSERKRININSNFEDYE